MLKIKLKEGPSTLLSNTNLIKQLKSRWNVIHELTDVFRYKINNLQEKLVDKKYLLQLNPNRGTERRTPENIDNICQTFNRNKFNFTKVAPEEVLFNIISDVDELNQHILLVNVSPISRYHSLLCPSVNKCLPQIITADSLKLTLELMFLAQHRDLRIVFNGLCALASVNHLHFHLLLEANTLLIEYAKCKHIGGPLYRLDETYPVPGFCFQVSKHSVDQSSEEIFRLLAYFLSNSIAHNVFMTRGDSVEDGGDKEAFRVVVWPRKSSSGAKQLGAFNVAACELSGWFPVYSKEDYETLTTEDLEKELRKWKIENFENLCEEVKSLF